PAEARSAAGRPPGEQPVGLCVVMLQSGVRGITGPPRITSSVSRPRARGQRHSVADHFLLALAPGRGMLGIMSTGKPPLSRLSELASGQRADFFALLVDRSRGVTREGKPYYHCRFRDDRRTVSFMAWGDDRWFEPAERDWQPGQFYKLRAVYQEHERY